MGIGLDGLNFETNKSTWNYFEPLSTKLLAQLKIDKNGQPALTFQLPLVEVFPSLLTTSVNCKNELLSAETTAAAGTADAERAAIANDVGATIEDRSQFRAEHRNTSNRENEGSGDEGRFRYGEGGSGYAAVKRGAPSKHSTHDRERRRASQSSAVGAGGCSAADDGDAGQRVD